MLDDGLRIVNVLNEIQITKVEPSPCGAGYSRMTIQGIGQPLVIDCYIENITFEQDTNDIFMPGGKKIQYAGKNSYKIILNGISTGGETRAGIAAHHNEIEEPKDMNSKLRDLLDEAYPDD